MAIPATLRSRIAAIWLFLFGGILFFVYAPLPDQADQYRDTAVNSAVDAVWHPYSPHQQNWKPTELKDLNSKYAYATFLAGNDKSEDEDVYLLGARLLAYQLIHEPKTKSNNSIPFIVIVTKTVTSAKIERLQRDGAVVVVVDDLVSHWIGKINPRFKDVMTKLRLWEFTQFERICLIDGDTVLMDNIDGVFDDPAVKLLDTQRKAEAVKDDEAPLPSQYAFASTAEPSAYPFRDTCYWGTTLTTSRNQPRLPSISRKERISIRSQLSQQWLYSLQARRPDLRLLQIPARDF
jgi:alpha-N-acetylglucosamine transferase